MTKAFFAAVASAAFALGVAACSAEPEAPVDTAPDAPEGISVSAGRMNLPAVTGNPASVYFSITNNSGAEQAIRAVHVDGAESATLHQSVDMGGAMDMQGLLQIEVPAGETVSFEPGGMHVMAANIDEALEVGGEIEVTLSFARGDKVSFPVTLLAPGDDGMSMEMGD